MKMFGQIELNNNKTQGVSEIQELRVKRFGYFFDDRIIDEFCDAIHKENSTNQPISTRDKSNQKYLDELNHNGLCVIKDLFEKGRVNKEHDKLLSSLLDLKARASELANSHGQASGVNIAENHKGMRVNFEIMSNIIRIWDVDIAQKSLADFKDNPIIYDICSSYFGGSMNTSNLYAEYKWDKTSYDPNLHLHADTPFRQLKVFVLLNDINEKNAPFIYFKKTHRMGGWRMMKDLLDFSSFNKKFTSSFGFSRLEMAKLSANYPDLSDSESLITGQAGDVIIVETRGVHGGTSLQEGHRLQLGLVYSSLGTQDMSNIPNRIKSLTSNSVQ